MSALLCAAAAVWASWPALSGAGQLIGGGEQPDWTGTLWTGWALLQGGLGLFGAGDPPQAFFPIGGGPAGLYNLLDAAMLAPLIGLFGPVMGWNIGCVLALVSSGLAGTALARAAGASHWPATAAGLLLLFSPMVLLEVATGRLAQALLAPFLLTLAGLVSLLRSTSAPDRRLAIAVGVGAAITALGYWYYGAMLFFAGVLWVLATRPWQRAAVARRLALAVVVGAALVALPVGALISHWSDLPGVSRAPEAWMNYGALGRQDFDLSMAIFNSQWPLWPVWASMGDLADRRMSAVLLFSAGVGAAVHRRAALPWLALAALGWVLTLGPWLKGGDGQPMAIPLPYLAMVDLLPPMRRLWWPERFELLALGGLVPLAGLGLDALSERISLGGGRGRAALALAVLVALPALAGGLSPWTPLPASGGRPVASGLYSQLDGAILTTPVMGGAEDSRHALWLQIHHGESITGGLGDHLDGHRPPDWAEWVRGNRLLAALSRVGAGQQVASVIQPEDVQALVDAGVRWAVVDPATLPLRGAGRWEQAHRAVFESVWGPPTLQLQRAAAWRVTPIPTPVTLNRQVPLQVRGGPPQAGRQAPRDGGSGRGNAPHPASATE